MPQSQEETVSIHLTEQELDYLYKWVFFEDSVVDEEVEQSIQKKISEAKEHFPHA